MINLINLGLYITEKVNGINISNIDFANPQTLLDADIVIINPEAAKYLWKARADELAQITFQTKRDQHVSTSAALIERRRGELELLSTKKRVIIILLTPLYSFQIASHYIGQDETFYNYSFLPIPIGNFIVRSTNGRGNKIILKDSKNLFAGFQKAFADDLTYYIYFAPFIDRDFIPFLENQTGQTVGFSCVYDASLFVFLPITLNVNTEKFIGTIVECSKKFLFGDNPISSPEWIRDFVLPNEKDKQGAINLIQKRIDAFEQEKKLAIKSLLDITDFKKLLYEKGTPLEKIAFKAFELLGYSVSQYKSHDMEHDLIIDSSEGRAIIEIEGKENSAINIDKLDQLTRVVDEDFSLNDKESEGILLGNHYSKINPLDRKEAFTDKVKIAAKRKGFVLISTVELYKTVEYIMNNDNEAAKERIRKLIFDSKGGEFKLS